MASTRARADCEEAVFRALASSDLVFAFMVCCFVRSLTYQPPLVSWYTTNPAIQRHPVAPGGHHPEAVGSPADSHLNAYPTPKNPILSHSLSLTPPRWSE